MVTVSSHHARHIEELSQVREAHDALAVHKDGLEAEVEKHIRHRDGMTLTRNVASMI